MLLKTNFGVSDQNSFNAVKYTWSKSSLDSTFEVSSFKSVGVDEESKFDSKLVEWFDNLKSKIDKDQ